MVFLAVEEADKGTGRLSGAGNSGRGWLEGGGQRRRALPGSAPTTGASAAAGFSLGLSSGIGGGPGGRQASRCIAGFLSEPAATKNNHWGRIGMRSYDIEVKAPEADPPLAGFVDFLPSGKAIVEISNN